eukprot:GHVT01098232.1.p1 GENE.GHVT01098232.1~~GHVT01098232.1.p1  ORF type:complete len:359 (+),score=79.68 GHVT01098232.1:3287-4363(+)
MSGHIFASRQAIMFCFFALFGFVASSSSWLGSEAPSMTPFSQSLSLPSGMLLFARAEGDIEELDIEDAGDENLDVGPQAELPPMETLDDVAALIQMSGEDLKMRVAGLYDAMHGQDKTNITPSDVEEFYKKVTADSQKRSIHAEFASMDTDEDGQISFDELKAGTIEDDEETPIMKVEDLRNRFDAVDMDKSGTLNEAELSMMMDPSKNEQLMAIEVKEILAAQDTNHDGRVSLPEFLNTEELRQAETDGEKVDKKELEEEFHLYDLNGDGFIDVPEMEQVIANPSIGELRSYIKTIFADKASISKEEWMADAHKHAVSVLTDNAELLRMPEEYPSVQLPFQNVMGIPAAADSGHDEL